MISDTWAEAAEQKARDSQETNEGPDPADHSDGGGSNFVRGVHMTGRWSNYRQRWIRLESAWLSGNRVDEPVAECPEDWMRNAAVDPTGRARTPLSAKDVAAIRSARRAGVPVIDLAHRYRVNRSTIWEKARDR